MFIFPFKKKGIAFTFDHNHTLKSHRHHSKYTPLRRFFDGNAPTLKQPKTAISKTNSNFIFDANLFFYFLAIFFSSETSKLCS